MPYVRNIPQDWEPVFGLLNGGLDLGVMQVFDATPVWHVEIDPAPAAILASHYPDVPNLGDVTRVDWAEVPPVDIITAGYPCQPFSQAGHRKGTNDGRHLWPHVRDAIKYLRPRFALFENVSGHVTLGLAEVLEDLAEIGFDAQWACTRASESGAPHHRERIFILAYPSGQRLEARQWARRPAEEIPWDYDVLGLIQYLDESTDPRRELEEIWANYWPTFLTWALATGRYPPNPWDQFGVFRPYTRLPFIEWMMGLPLGWVTLTFELTRAQKLKALGNGVVPQQAAAALTELLGRIG